MATSTTTAEDRIMSGTHVVYAEDLAAALVGPFKSAGDAQLHIELCEMMNHAAEMKVLSVEAALALRATVGIEIPAEADVLEALATAAGPFLKAHEHCHQPWQGDIKLMRAALAAAARLGIGAGR
ncbi:MAG: hypothetical protein V4597_08335 [Pseudomonadota bacterium]